MSDIRDIENEIRKGKNLEQNIPVYLNSMASLYGEFALHNLAMSLSMQLDKTEFDDTELDKHNKELYDGLLEEIKKLGEKSFSPEENKASIEKTIGIRETVRHRMEAVTALVDDLVIYEYMLNRLEPKFEYVPKEETSDDDLAREILKWIFKDEENALINERIKTAVSCLPIRLTKGKIADLVETTFSLYSNSDKKAIDTFDYMLRSASGMYKTDKIYDVYDNVNELLEELRQADYANLEDRHYYDLRDDYRLASNLVSGLADELTDLQELSNALLAVLLTRQYFTLEGEKNCEKVFDIIRKMVEGDADYDALFGGTEGRIESLNERINDEESVLLVIKEHYAKQVEELMLTVPFQRLLMTCRLCGESTFADLIEDNTKIDDNYLEEVKTKFTKDLEELLKNGGRLKNRAVMAQLLRELPVMLSTHTEVMDYVRQALNSCTDPGEKQISVNLIRECYD
ncbi:MAG: hypothetical protein K6G60_09600 [Lachnospiraceae bacterium]|nr:hypothetical protein [Lachnospiraceae bacterium]